MSNGRSTKPYLRHVSDENVLLRRDSPAHKVIRARVEVAFGVRREERPPGLADGEVALGRRADAGGKWEAKERRAEAKRVRRGAHQMGRAEKSEASGGRRESGGAGRAGERDMRAML